MLSCPTWDIFCTVVDNFGDIGVSFRLARQLASEYKVAVRLWVDDLASLHKLCPELDPGLEVQFQHGVEVRHWPINFPEVLPADVVVEAFACELPGNYLAAMATRTVKPIWINLEYLSAETWVQGCHGLPSPHPRLPLLKYFFFPGFASGTGGVLIERGLMDRRQAFQQDPKAQTAFWRALGLPPQVQEEFRVSLFCYENKAAMGLLAAWADEKFPVVCLIPEGRVLCDVSVFFGETVLRPGRIYRSGNLTAHILPFMAHDRYDKLLWACNLNFVRGEDSFVRAQLAALPLVWHIYPQRGQAHCKKLDAFMDIYCANLPQDTAACLRAFWESWNGEEDVRETWPGLLQHWPALQEHARRWADGLPEHGDLASNLMHFCKNKLQ